MTGRWRLGCIACIACGVALAGAQAQPATAQKKPSSSAFPWPQTEMHFSDGKPVLGLPEVGLGGRMQCALDGTTFVHVRGVDQSPDVTAPPELYSVSADGNVKRLERKLPAAEFNSVSVMDFFVAEHTLVSLLRAERMERGASRDVRWFLSTEDHDGDGQKLTELDVRFRPLKVGLLGSGDYLVLGWDEPNSLPVMALVKEDGSVRRFLDFEDKHMSLPYNTPPALREAEEKAAKKTDQRMLEQAQLVPFGSTIMLTFPGTTRMVHVMSSTGETSGIPMAWPGGMVLRDMLVTNTREPLVARMEVQHGEAEGTSQGVVKAPVLKLFEFDVHHGSLIREDTVAQPPKVEAMTCAVNRKLTAVFMATVKDTVNPAAANDKPAEDAPEQVVVATATR